MRRLTGIFVLLTAVPLALLTGFALHATSEAYESQATDHPRVVAAATLVRGLVEKLRTTLISAAGIVGVALVGGLVLLGLSLKDRRRAEEALRGSEERIRSIIDTASDALIGMDADGLITDWSPQAEATFGWSRDEAIGRSVAETIVPERFRDAHMRGLRQFLVTGEGPVLGKRVELVALHHEGHEFPVELAVNALRSGEAPSFHAFVHDITERKRTEQALGDAREQAERAREEAERANRAKSEFLSRMSHELRTPLNAVLGFGQLLEMDDLDPEQMESVHQILKGGRHLLELINEVLDIARIETGRLALSPEPVQLYETLSGAVELVQPLARERGIRIETDELEEEGDRYVLADRQRLRQVLLNLLSNAVKYNRQDGRVTVHTKEVGGDGVRISVIDEGTGIPLEKMDRLFTPFDRLGVEATGVEGTGLGLALSKLLVEAMGGRMDVQSAYGEGSTFSVQLPLSESPEVRYLRLGAEVSHPPSIPEGAHTILQIEDNPANLKLVERVLEGFPGVRVISAPQGRLGLELARQHDLDVILLDLNLPDISGFEILRILRADPATRDIPVIVISADATKEQVRRLLDAGARAYVTKPLEVAQFAKVVGEALEERGLDRAQQ